MLESGSSMLPCVSRLCYHVQHPTHWFICGGRGPLERTFSFIPVLLSLCPTSLYIPHASPHLLLLDQVHPWNSLISVLTLPQVHMPVMCVALTLYYTFSFQRGPMPTCSSSSSSPLPNSILSAPSTSRLKLSAQPPP